jgi:hypothetical protein
MTANDGQVSAAAVPVAGKSDRFADWLTDSLKRACFCLLPSNRAGSRRCYPSGWSTFIREMR